MVTSSQVPKCKIVFSCGIGLSQVPRTGSNERYQEFSPRIQFQQADRDTIDGYIEELQEAVQGSRILVRSFTEVFSVSPRCGCIHVLLCSCTNLFVV